MPPAPGAALSTSQGHGSQCRTALSVENPPPPVSLPFMALYLEVRLGFGSLSNVKDIPKTEHISLGCGWEEETTPFFFPPAYGAVVSSRKSFFPALLGIPFGVTSSLGPALPAFVVMGFYTRSFSHWLRAAADPLSSRVVEGKCQG